MVSHSRSESLLTALAAVLLLRSKGLQESEAESLSRLEAPSLIACSNPSLIACSNPAMELRCGVMGERCFWLGERERLLVIRSRKPLSGEWLDLLEEDFWEELLLKLIVRSITDSISAENFDRFSFNLCWLDWRWCMPMKRL